MFDQLGNIHQRDMKGRERKLQSRCSKSAKDLPKFLNMGSPGLGLEQSQAQVSKRFGRKEVQVIICCTKRAIVIKMTPDLLVNLAMVKCEQTP